MNISKINIAYNNSFKGLWGETKYKTDIDTVMNIQKSVETKYYYPFADESPEEISSIVKSNTNARMYTANKNYSLKECKVGVPLPFTKQEYEKYKALKGRVSLTEKIQRIHAEVLNKFSNGDYENQEPAFNENVKQRLNTYF